MSIILDEKNHYILTASCDSRMGTVAAISGFLAKHNCYIVDMHQFDDVITNRFFIRTSFYAEPQHGASLEDLKSGFADIAIKEKMEWGMHDCSRRPRVLIMVSKFDHCLYDLLYRHRTGELKIDITAVVSNHRDLEDLVTWRKIPFIHLPVSHATKVEKEAELLKIISDTESELVVLARYMQVFSDDLCQKLRGKAINIHHSFLPGFKGAKPYHQAHERGVKLIGATAHYVTGDLDEGPIIEQIVERVDHTYTPDMLAAVGRDSECQALARAIRFHTQQRVFLNGDKTVIFK